MEVAEADPVEGQIPPPPPPSSSVENHELHGAALSSVDESVLERIERESQASPSGLGSDLVKRKRDIELLGELFRRRTKKVLREFHENQKKWREELRQRSRNQKLKARGKKKKERNGEGKRRRSGSGDGGEKKKSQKPKDETYASAGDIPDQTAREWKKSEQEKARKVLLVYGLGEWVKIQKVLWEEQKTFAHGIADIRNFAFTFLGALKKVILLEEQKGEEKGEGEEDKKAEEAKKVELTSPSPSLEWMDTFLTRKMKQLSEEGAVAIDNLINTWPKIERLGQSWVRKIRLLAGVREAVHLHRDEETKWKVDETLRVLSRPPLPVDWWSSESDLALLFGTYKHGYGAYEKIRNDAEYLEAFGKKKEMEEEQQEEEEVAEPSKGAQEQGSSQALDWPQVETLTKRLKRIVDVLAKVTKKEEVLQLRAEKAEQKANEWTKRDRWLLARTIMRYGKPVNQDGESDWARLRNLSGGLKQKNELSIQTCFESLMEEATFAVKTKESKRTPSKINGKGLDSSTLNAESIQEGAEGENAQDAKKDGEEVIHDCESLEKTKDVSESNKDEADMENGGGAEMKKEEDDRNEDHQTGNEREEKNDLAEAGKILAEVDDKGNPAGDLEVLTATTASRLIERIKYMSLLRQIVADDWELDASRLLQSLPPWWTYSHDLEVMRGLIHHGFQKFDLLELDFKLPDRNVCINRIKQICKFYRKKDEIASKAKKRKKMRKKAKDEMETNEEEEKKEVEKEKEVQEVEMKEEGKKRKEEKEEEEMEDKPEMEDSVEKALPTNEGIVEGDEDNKEEGPPPKAEKKRTRAPPTRRSKRIRNTHA